MKKDKNKKVKNNRDRKISDNKNSNTTNDKYCLYESIVLVALSIISFIFDKVVIKIITAIQHPLLFQLFYSITLLGELYVFALIVLLIAGALMMYRKPITTLIVTTASAGIIGWLLKSLINRPRPFEAANINSLISTNLSSFPSGHTLLFFSIVPIISKNFPKIKILIWTLAVLVGFSRIYLGVHYFSDVVCGAIIGYGIGLIVLKIGEKYAWKY